MSSSLDKAAPFGSRSVAAILGVTTTISYGTHYYGFGVMAPQIAAEFGLSVTAAYGLFSASILAGGLVAPRAGRLIDRLGGARAMAWGSATSALVLAALSQSPSAALFGVCLVLLQMISTLVLYDAAFAVATGTVPAFARRAITGITLIAGFSSTVFWPLTLGLMEAGWDWRQVYLAFGVLNLLVCAPLHAWFSSRSQRALRHGEATARPVLAGRNLDRRARRMAFGLCVLTFGATGFVISGLHANMVYVVASASSGAVAALAGSVIGPAQVAGRLGEYVLGPRVTPAGVAVFALIAASVGLAAMGVWLGPGPAMLVAAALYGTGQGLTSIARGTLPLDIFGSQGFGSLLGRLNSAYLVAMAAGPVVAAAVYERAGAAGFFTLLSAAALAGCGAATALFFLVRSDADQTKAP